MRRGVGTGEAGVAQGEVDRVDPVALVREPAAGLAKGETCPQPVTHWGRGGGGGGFEPGQRILGVRQGQQEGRYVLNGGCDNHLIIRLRICLIEAIAVVNSVARGNLPYSHFRRSGNRLAYRE